MYVSFGAQDREFLTRAPAVRSDRFCAVLDSECGKCNEHSLRRFLASSILRTKMRKTSPNIFFLRNLFVMDPCGGTYPIELRTMGATGWVE